MDSGAHERKQRVRNRGIEAPGYRCRASPLVSDYLPQRIFEVCNLAGAMVPSIAKKWVPSSGKIYRFASSPGTRTLDKMMRDRKHLVSAEVDKLLDAAKSSRNAARDRCFLLLMFRHGLRVSEACGLKLSQVDTESRVLHVTRLKAGLSTTHLLRGTSSG